MSRRPVSLPSRTTGPAIAALLRLLCLLTLAWGQGARAQTLDDIEQRSQGETQVVRIRFNASVRFLQLVPATAADFYTLRFEMVQADESVLRQTLDEVRRLPAAAGMPALVLGYTPEPGSRTKQLTVRLGTALPLQARQGPNTRSLELVFHGRPPGPGAKAPETAPLAPPDSPRRYALLLQTVTQADKDQIRAIPNEFQSLEVLTTAMEVDGVPGYQITVGYFASEKEAGAALALALPRFPQARVIDLSSVIALAAPPSTLPTPALAPSAAPVATAPSLPAPAPAPAPEPAPVPPPVVPPAAPPAAAAAAAEPIVPGATAAQQDAVERDAAALLAQARAALAAGQADAAITLLDQLLKLPPNAQTMAAQELIGQAWEKADNPLRARIEYGLYLRLYPQGEGAARVAERLAALGGAPAPTVAGTAATATTPVKPWAGNVAQYYYGGKAKSKSLVNIATGIDQATLSRTTESSIVTSVDLSGRYVGTDQETRAVVRGSGSSNLLSTGHSSSSIGSAYVEHRRTGEGALAGLAVRAGRQSPISGGLLGLFDGVSLAYPVTPGLKLDVMGGVPASALVSAPGERLFAAVLEADSLAERWAGNFYLLDQSTQGITNRRALGAELRYAGEQWSLNSLVDYDSVFGLVNAVSLHASVQAGPQTTVTMLVDERRAPSLQLTNALISSGAASLKTLLQTRSLAQVKDDALATSAIARQFLVSVARPLDTRWQASMDLRYSAVGALPAVGDFEATAATGGQVSWSAQLTGTNLYSARDINNFNLSLIRTPFFTGWQLAYNNLSGVPGWQELTVEPSLRLYGQRDKQDVKLLRVGPGVRLSWRASRKASLLGELLYERSRTDGPANHDTSNSVFFYVGYRYELF